MPPPPPPNGSHAAEENDHRVEQNFSKKRVGEGEVQLDRSKLANALSEEKKRKMMRGELDEDDRGGKRKKREPDASAKGSHDVTEEQLGALFSLCFLIVRTDLSFRGVQDESSYDRGSNGKLCRRGRLIALYRVLHWRSYHS